MLCELGVGTGYLQDKGVPLLPPIHGRSAEMRSPARTGLAICASGRGSLMGSQWLGEPLSLPRRVTSS